MKNMITINSKVPTDEIIDALQSELTIKQLIEFALELGSNLSDSEGYYKGLQKRISKLKFDAVDDSY